LFAHKYSYAQNTSYEHLDTLINEYVKELHIKDVDTVLIYEDYFIGSWMIDKGDSNRCVFRGIYVPTYIIWLKNGKTFLSKKDNCFDYSIIEIDSPQFWNIFFTNYNIIKKEVVEPFQFISYDKNEKVVSTMYIDHSGHKNFKMIIGSDTTAMEFSSFIMQKQIGRLDETKININYEHNKNLKGRLFIENINNLVQEIENKKSLNKTRR
jgi:hypothetical protein